jgi:hypothetical protein
MKFWIILIIILIIALALGLGLGLGLKREKFENSIVTTDEDYSYLVSSNGSNVLYSSRKFPRDRKLWAQEIIVKGPIIEYLTSMSIKYNKPYLILADDFDRVDFIPKNKPKDSLYFVASLNTNSDPFTFPIPQNDKSFQGARTMDVVPFSQKNDKIIWRGAHSKAREEFLNGVTNSNDSQIKIDIQLTNDSNFMTPEEQMKNKYILCIDGHGWPGSINWSLESKCCTFIRSDKHLWYYDLLEPWVDFVPVRDFNELIDSLEILRNNQELAEQIGINGSEKIKKILNLQQQYIELIFSNAGKTYAEVINKLTQTLNN